MKKYIPINLLLLLFFGSAAQDQFSNSGNFTAFAGASITFFGNFSNSGTFSDAGQSVSFKGASTQTITGSSVTTFNNLTINNAAGVSMQQSVTISNSLILTSGRLSLNSNLLTLNNSAPSAVSRTSGYILSEQSNNSGRVKWNIGSNTGAFAFPFGTGSGAYIPFTLNHTSGNIGNVTLSTYPTAVNNTPYPTTPFLVTNMNDNNNIDVSANVVDRFWEIDKDGPAGTADLYFTAAPSEIGSIVNMQAQRWSPTLPGWESPLPGQTNAINSVTVPGVTNFAVWTLAGNGSVLPIGLLNFDAVPHGSEVLLNWETTSEKNSKYFLVEKSKDGLSFKSIATVNAAGNSSSASSYASIDKDPWEGINYYRLKQLDTDNNPKYSDIKAVEFKSSSNNIFTLFPNPGDGLNIHVSVETIKGQEISVVLDDFVGRKYYSKTFKAEAELSDLVINPELKLPSGIYNLRISSNEMVYSKKYIVQ
jgi:hypothetical protein